MVFVLGKITQNNMFCTFFHLGRKTDIQVKSEFLNVSYSRVSGRNGLESQIHLFLTPMKLQILIVRIIKHHQP